MKNYFKYFLIEYKEILDYLYNKYINKFNNLDRKISIAEFYRLAFETTDIQLYRDVYGKY
jgi:hypothetical protein